MNAIGSAATDPLVLFILLQKKRDQSCELAVKVNLYDLMDSYSFGMM